MTVASNTPFDQYSATAGQTVFNYTFEIVEQTDILVYQRGNLDAPNDPNDLLQLNVDYTVTGVGNDNGGTIILTVPATVDDVITLKQNVPLERDTSFTNGGVLRAQDLNNEFDAQMLSMQVTRFNDQQRMLRYWNSAILGDPKDLIIPVLDANQIWAMNNAGTEIIPYNVPAGGGIAPGDATYLVQTANADLPNAQVMASLASGFVFNTTATGVQNTRVFEGTPNQLGVTNPDGLSGNPAYFIVNNPTIPGTAGMGIPAGTTAQRVIPTPPSIGLRQNTDLNVLEYWNGFTWIQLASAASAGVNGNVQYNNMGTTDGDPDFNTDGAGNVDIDGSLIVDNLQIDGNKISSLDTDGHINLDPNGLGMVLLGGGIPSIGLQPDTILFNMAEDAKSAYILPASYTNTSINAPIYLTQKSRSEVVGNHVAVQENDALSYWSANGDDGTSFRSAVRIVSRVDGSVSPNIVPGRYTIQTADSTGTLQNALRIDSNQITTLFNPLLVSSGGTGLASTTAYGLIAGGTTSTGNLQNVGTGTAGQTLRSNGASALPTWQDPGGVTWQEITGTTQTIVPNRGYIANNAAPVVFTLPATSALGTIVNIVGKGAGGWTIEQNAGQNIQIGAFSTTVGTSGSIESTNRYDSIQLVCTTANTTWTTVGGPQSSGINVI